jgi:hypothetical protein
MTTYHQYPPLEIWKELTPAERRQHRLSYAASLDPSACFGWEQKCFLSDPYGDDPDSEDEYSKYVSTDWWAADRDGGFRVTLSDLRKAHPEIAEDDPVWATLTGKPMSPDYVSEVEF